MFVGTAAFTGVGQVRTRYDGGGTLVEIDLGGDATPDMIIRLSGRIPPSAGDFKPSAG